MPTLTVSPNPAAPGTTATAQGSGFGSRTNVRLLVGGAEAAYFTTGSAGTFNRSFQVPAGVTSVIVRAYSTRGCAEATLAVGVPVPPPPPPPPPPPTGGGASVTVTSLTALLSALADNANGDITLKAGTYVGSIIVDSRFANRTLPVRVHCEGAVLDGGGAVNQARLGFRGGAHHQDWYGLAHANTTLLDTGVIMFGGWDEPAAHHLGIHGSILDASIRRTRVDHTTEHGVYFSMAQGGCHDLLIEDLTEDAPDAMGLATMIHADHGSSLPLVNAWNVTVRRCRFKGNRPTVTSPSQAVQQAVILWMYANVHDWTIDDITSVDSGYLALRYESLNGQRINVSNFVSTGSYGYQGSGFYSSLGPNPAGLVLGPGVSLR